MQPTFATDTSPANTSSLERERRMGDVTSPSFNMVSTCTKLLKQEIKASKEILKGSETRECTHIEKIREAIQEKVE